MARKKRQYLQQEQTHEPVSAMLPAVWETAIYARLSVENSKKNDDGDSIEGQIEICRDYVSEHPYLHLADAYVDNGWTGTNTDRPEFQRLLKDIRMAESKRWSSRISAVSRDYIEAGNLLENIFLPWASDLSLWLTAMTALNGRLCQRSADSSEKPDQ